MGVRPRLDARPLTEREQRDAWKEIRRREWLRARAEKEARERERVGEVEFAGCAKRRGESGEAAGERWVAGCAGAVSECGVWCAATDHWRG